MVFAVLGHGEIMSTTAYWATRDIESVCFHRLQPFNKTLGEAMCDRVTRLTAHATNILGYGAGVHRSTMRRLRLTVERLQVACV